MFQEINWQESKVSTWRRWQAPTYSDATFRKMLENPITARLRYLVNPRCSTWFFRKTKVHTTWYRNHTTTGWSYWVLRAPATQIAVIYCREGGRNRCQGWSTDFMSYLFDCAVVRQGPTANAQEYPHGRGSLLSLLFLTYLQILYSGLLVR